VWREAKNTELDMKHVLTASILFASLACCDCIPGGGSIFGSNRAKPIVEKLKAPDAETRSAALDELHAIAKNGLRKREGVYALRAAAQDFPPLMYDWQNAPTELVLAASKHPVPEYLAPIRESFDSYPVSAQEAALGAVATIESRPAALLLVTLLREAREETGFPNLGTLEDRPRYADVLFPEILGLFERPSLRWPVAKLCLAYFSNELIREPEIKTRIGHTMVRAHNALQAKLAPLQRNSGVAWMWEDDYQEDRDLAALVLDVLGYPGTTEANRELTEALAYIDPQLKLYAVLGLVRQGQAVPPEHLLAVAKSPETRNWLHDQLQNMGKVALFPPDCASQKDFAEGEMVTWLIYPTELGRAPDEIQLMAVVPRTYSDGEAEFFVFRFRTFEPHWAAKDGWIAGVAGPFLKGASPSTKAYGGTFSMFTPYDDLPPEEHVAKIEALLEKSREHWAKSN
jgi:hypothetical protein